MEKFTIHLPTMYGDHHVLEVRRILLELPGVKEVYASSCFQIVEVEYDPAVLDVSVIKAKLGENGYVQELAVAAETGVAAYNGDLSSAFIRHTVTYEQTRQVITFAQEVSDAGRPLWPCPGLGIIERIEEEMNGDG